MGGGKLAINHRKAKSKTGAWRRHMRHRENLHATFLGTSLPKHPSGHPPPPHHGPRGGPQPPHTSHPDFRGELVTPSPGALRAEPSPCCHSSVHLFHAAQQRLLQGSSLSSNHHTTGTIPSLSTCSLPRPTHLLTAAIHLWDTSSPAGCSSCWEPHRAAATAPTPLPG